MIAKVLRALGLGHIAYKLVSPCYSSIYRKKAALGDVQAALKLLTETSPSPGSSCYIQGRSHHSQEQAAEVDIIIPAYNVEKYIGRCLDSVISQKTRYSFRVLVVDDGSTDTTGAILRGYEGIEIIRQDNAGLSAARNTALEYSQSEYVMFLDSDDELCPGTLEKLMDAARAYDAAIVEGGYTEIYPDERVLRRHRHCQGVVPAISLDGYAWGKIIRRSLFDHAVFPKGYWYQDSLMRQIIYPMADKLGYKSVGISDGVVLYRQNPEGITKKSRAKGKSLQSLYITMQLFEDRKKYGLEINGDYYNYILGMAVQTYSRTSKQSEDVKMAIFTVYADFIEKNFQGWKTQDRKLACLEKALAERDYGGYMAYCELH